MVRLAGFLGRLLGLLLKNSLPLMKNVLKPLAKTVLIPLALTAAAASAAVSGIHKKILGSGMHPDILASRPLDLPKRTTLIISNKEMDIMKIVKSLEDSGLLIKGVSKTIKN